MTIGAVAFTVYCLAAVPLARRFGTWRGSGAALTAWAPRVGGVLLAFALVITATATRWPIRATLVHYEQAEHH